MKYLIASAVGAIIGFITNWLAIKMLFRPYAEKRFLGIKIPFTPGLIPKEKSRIAKSVGMTIGTHLLSKDTIKESLCTPSMKAKLNEWTMSKAHHLVSSHMTLEDAMKVVLKDDFENLENKIASKMADCVASALMSENAEVQLKSLLSDALVRHADSAIRKNVELGNVFPEILSGKVKVSIFNRRREICAELKHMLEGDSAQNKITSTVQGMMANMSPMMAMFLDANSLSSKITSVLQGYLDAPENQDEIAMLLNSTLDKLLHKKLGDVFSCTEADESTRAAVSQLVDKSLRSDLIFGSEQLIKGEIHPHVLRALKSLENACICEIVKGNEERIFAIAEEMTSSLYEKFIENHAEDVIETLDVSKIVEDKINEFQVDFAEKIILEIAQKELSAITWLGALLGGIMGILSPLLSSIY